MQFNSYSYLSCLFLAVCGFWALPVGGRRAYVLALSVAFYATWNVYFLALPLAVCTIAYVAAGAIRRAPGSASRSLGLGIAAVLAILVVCKYLRFVAENLALVSGFHGGSLTPLLNVGLPLGISFYSFEAISYLIDTRQGRVPSSSFADLGLFVMFWPHLIAGPIVRSRELIPQLKFQKPFESRFVMLGLDRLLLGLVQKNVIANSIGPWVDDGFLPKVAPFNTTLDNWALAVAFGLQIYFDFAAYSNMAIGAAQLIGVTLPENFRHPYYASTPADFWSRWHMTLSRWIRDYVFFPLNAGFQHQRVRLYVSLIGVMALVGLWHGAGWGFILWGTMHGVFLVFYRIFEPTGGEKALGVGARLCWRAFTLAAVAAAWVPFRSPSIGQAATMLSAMTWRFTPGLSYSVNFYLTTLMWCAVCALEPWTRSLLSRLDEAAERRPAAVRTNAFVLRPVAYACLLLLFLVFDDRDAQFIYFQF